MNRRQIINKILHKHIDVNKYEDYTNYKELITAIEKWHDGEVEKLNIHNVIASDFLTSRKLPYGNTMRAIFKKNPNMWEIVIYHICETFLHEGYMLAVRRLKNNSL